MKITIENRPHINVEGKRQEILLKGEVTELVLGNFNHWTATVELRAYSLNHEGLAVATASQKAKTSDTAIEIAVDTALSDLKAQLRD